MKNLSETLVEKGYTLDSVLNHQELINFVVLYLFKKNSFTIGFLIFNVLAFAGWLTLVIFQLYYGVISSAHTILWSAIGFLISLLLAPLHELLHGLAYRICGAKEVSYKANWKKLYIMAIADQFVIGRKAFIFIGLTPFIVISIGLLLLSIWTTHSLQLMWLAALWFHATMCAGDFGLVSYFEENKSREVVTFDDARNGMSYFYSRKA